MSKPPGKRREGREAALQFLFSHDLNETEESEVSEDSEFWRLRPAKPGVRAFAVELLRGILKNRIEIDEAIAAVSENYSLNRITAVDRNILRLAVYELLFRDDIPAAVTINEAVEIAKRFGTSESARFINGIVDRISKSKAATTTANDQPASH